LIALLHHGNQFLFAMIGLVLLAGSELAARRRAAWRPVASRVVAAGALALVVTAPLTIAMALQEKGWFYRAPIEISASDASPAAVEKARRGLYRERSFRNLPQAMRDKYFTEGP